MTDDCSGLRVRAGVAQMVSFEHLGNPFATPGYLGTLTSRFHAVENTAPGFVA